MEDAFQKYECYVENICEEYKEASLVYTPTPYEEVEKHLSWTGNVTSVSNTSHGGILYALHTYKTNMNNLYNCAMIQSQKNAITLLQTKLVSLDKTGDLKKYFVPKLQTLLTKTNTLQSQYQCKNIDKESIFYKHSILKQATYETCSFHLYMNYLKEKYQNPSYALTGIIQDTKGIPLPYSLQAIASIQRSIDKEIEHSKQIFSLSYHAYTEYENNLPIHLLLQLIKEDLMIYRDKLYQALNPINQVVYKISNAMNK